MKIQDSVSQRARCMSMSRKGGAGRFRTRFVRDGHGNAGMKISWMKWWAMEGCSIDLVTFTIFINYYRL